MRPQAGLDEIAPGTDFGVMEKRLEPGFNVMDKARRRIRRICRNENPYLGKVVFRRFGYVEGERSFNFLCPFLMILSALKALTLPAAMS